MKLTYAVFSSLALVSVVGCSKPSPAEQKKREDELAAAIASTLSAPMPPSGTAAATPGDTGKILAQCVRKETNTCRELSGVLSPMEDQLCKGADGAGVYGVGDKPCPKENVIATCETMGSEQKEAVYYYLDKTQALAAQREQVKTVCGFTSGKFAEIAISPAAPAKKSAAKSKR